MSPKLQPVRGTHDILPDDFEKFHAVVTRARELATLYGFREMATPIFEMTEVFARSMGETSDVVSKEMFTFQTKGEESVTLRPEFTAGNVRAFISNGMQQHLPLKLFSTGPVFRYERPQKGRQRQFHQVNYEWLGDDSVEADVETILLAGHLLHSISSSSKSCKLHINTLGDFESRVRYREALVAYLTPFAEELSEDSKRRLSENPLRILDSKADNDKKILINAPKITDYLSEQAKNRFESVYRLLKQKSISFNQEIIIDHSLVRGLDYYTDIVFEFVGETGELGTQNTVLAGGRYDGLVEQMGGKTVPAIGFAAGIERLLLLTEGAALRKYKDIKIVILPSEGLLNETALFCAEGLRTCLHDLLLSRNIKRFISVEIFWQGNLKKRMERADKRNATQVIMLSPGKIEVKNMETGERKEVSIPDFAKDEKLIEIFNITELDSRLRGNDEE